MAQERPLEVLLHHLRYEARGDGWEAMFARSILRQAKRPEWTPTAKQARIMNGIVEGALGGGAVIEEGEA